MQNQNKLNSRYAGNNYIFKLPSFSLVADFLIFLFVGAYLINEFIFNFYSCLSVAANAAIAFASHWLYNYLDIDFISNMVCCVNSSEASSSVVQASSHRTEVNVIHDDGSWANGLRSLFIYGTGALRLYLTRGGTPSSRAFVLASTIATDTISKVIQNTINDPAYVKNHYVNWQAIWKKGDEAEVRIDAETSSKINDALVVKKYLSDSNDEIANILNKLINYFIDNFKVILEPVTSNYSNEVLANQIHDLSILLFVMSILITILIVFLLINILVLINSDRIIKLFTNKYIRWYVNVNIKLIAIEVFCLGSSIIYFMYNLSKGLQYIATHPIVFS